ncbi:S-layer homology domain-containing protein [Bacillus mycoides]|uniref:S-layer homology domain-containing protein n=1 Tax=Bacillus mycoides TaxID=1405 RepID=UPI0008160CF4|nr:S-layer homology domain-containing protein [Bacillus mycoides]QWG32423.1 S-layer homology domain-containing protein [Bacillus mycoides]SCC02984.1 S-layer protein [Bacillus mycoides]
MKKRMLRIMTAATIMGGLLLNANVPNIKAEEYPEMIVFDDVPVDYWAYEYIIDVAYNKVMLGYGNGKFGVGDNVTREQVAAVLYRALNIKHEGPLHNPYKDISERSTMFPKEILALTEHGIFKGDEKGNFRPRETITRAEVAQVLTRAFSFEVKKKHTFTDVPNNYWAKNAISAIQTNNITNGIGENKFGPSMSVTREQYATFLYRAILNDEQQ